MQRFPSIVHTCRGIQACTYCITGRIVASGRCVLYMLVSKVIISYDNVNNSFKCVINIALCDAAQCNIAVKLRYLIHRDECICPGLRHFPQWWRWWWFYCSTMLLSMMVLPIMMTMMTLTRMGARGRCLEMTLKCVTIAVKNICDALINLVDCVSLCVITIFIAISLLSFKSEMARCCLCKSSAFGVNKKRAWWLFHMISSQVPQPTCFWKWHSWQLGNLTTWYPAE